MNIQQLNKLAGNGTVSFNCKDHINAPLIDKVKGDNVELNCRECKSLVINFDGVFGIKTIGHNCERGVIINYKLNSNQVILTCHHCKKEIGTIYMGEPQSSISVHWQF